MSVIDRFMPLHSLRQLDRVVVAASADRAYEVLRSADLQRLAFVRALFALRTLPERAAGALRHRQAAPARSARIEDITRPGSGFILLAEEPGREVVVGSVGKFWQPTIEFAPVTPESFAAFSQPGYGKLAWCLRVDRRESGGAWVSVELRVGATDVESLARFRSYWRLIGPFSRAIRHAMLRVIVRDLGPLDPEGTPAPGDAILPEAKFQRTRTTIIESPPARVWPWLIEIRALAGGDTLPAGPQGLDGFRVLQLEPSRSLVLGSPSPRIDASAGGGVPWHNTCAFLLEPIGDEATQLTVRVRTDHQPGLKMGLLGPLVGALHEVMERRQLHNVRRRAEAPGAV